jgi:hypothetical protein
MRNRSNPSGAARLSQAAVSGPSEALPRGPVATPRVAFGPVQLHPQGSVTANQHSVANAHRPGHRLAPHRWDCALIGAVLEMAKDP